MILNIKWHVCCFAFIRIGARIILSTDRKNESFLACARTRCLSYVTLVSEIECHFPSSFSLPTILVAKYDPTSYIPNRRRVISTRILEINVWNEKFMKNTMQTETHFTSEKVNTPSHCEIIIMNGYWHHAHHLKHLRGLCYEQSETDLFLHSVRDHIQIVSHCAHTQVSVNTWHCIIPWILWWKWCSEHIVSIITSVPLLNACTLENTWNLVMVAMANCVRVCTSPRTHKSVAMFALGTRVWLSLSHHIY